MERLSQKILYKVLPVKGNYTKQMKKEKRCILNFNFLKGFVARFEQITCSNNFQSNEIMNI